MSKENDVIVYDGDYTYANQMVNMYCDALIKMADDYAKCVSSLLEYAIHDKMITESLQSIVSSVEGIRPIIKDIGQQAAAYCAEYVREVDSADQFLY